MPIKITVKTLTGQCIEVEVDSLASPVTALKQKIETKEGIVCVYVYVYVNMFVCILMLYVCVCLHVLMVRIISSIHLWTLTYVCYTPLHRHSFFVPEAYLLRYDIHTYTCTQMHTHILFSTLATGKELQDNAPLSQYNIEDGCTIHLILRQNQVRMCMYVCMVCNEWSVRCFTVNECMNHGMELWVSESVSVCVSDNNINFCGAMRMCIRMDICVFVWHCMALYVLYTYAYI